MTDNPEQDEEKTSSSPSDETENPSEDFNFEEDLESKDEDAAPRKRSAEDRINQLIAKNKELEERLGHAEEKMTTSQQPTVTPPVTPKIDDQSPEVQRALAFLKESGFTTKEDLTKTIQEIEDRRILDQTHMNLESKYDGEDGRPQYRRTDVEKYMRENGVYNPEVAYKAFHEEELLDWRLKKAEGEQKKKPYVQVECSSTGQSDRNTITREKIAKAMLTPEGKAWYERNRKKILQLHAEGKLT
jgi:hypothetical protein